MFDSLTRLGASGAEAEYEIARSLRFTEAGPTYLTFTPSSASTQLKKWTISAWVKRGQLADQQGSQYWMGVERPSSVQAGTFSGFNVTNKWLLYEYPGGNSYDFELQSNGRFVDNTAWYHLVYIYDSTQGTAANRVKAYMNGIQITDLGAAAYPNQNHDSDWGAAEPHYLGIGCDPSGDDQPFNGYIADFHYIDGQAKAITDFGKFHEDTGAWVPIEYEGTYGTQGCHLDFSDNSNTTAATMGKDSSGNGNNWTPNNFATYKSVPDSPTNNFAVWNQHGEHTANMTITEGNLKFDSGSNGNTGRAVSTLRPTSGKWYAECWVGQHNRFTIGIENTHGNAASNTGGANNPNGILVGPESEAYYNGNTGNSYLGGDIGSDSIVMIAMDCDNKLVWVGLNGTWGQSVSNADIASATSAGSLGTFMSATAATLFQGDMGIFTEDNSGSNKQWSYINFGQDQGMGTALADASIALGNESDASGYGLFKYAVPSGFNALCTQNLADPEIKKPDDHFKMTAYTGNASTGSDDTITLSSLNFAPAMTWLKPESYIDNWVVFDTTRGAHKTLYINTNGIQGDRTSDDDSLTAFSSNGWTIKDWNNINKNGETYFTLNWKESAESGFDVVTYTGNNTNRTISHGLGVAPEVVIVKNLGDTNGNARGWMMQHHSLGPTHYIKPDTTGGAQDDATAWQDTAPTSSVFSIGADGSNVNQANDNFIGYVWKGKDGLSKFGKYEGNGNADGPFIYTGFQPAFVIVKVDGTDDWNTWNYLVNNPAQNSHDEVNYWNANYATGQNDSDHTAIFYSNGFKINTSNAQENADGSTYIYLAWAQVATKYATAFGIKQT